MKIVKLVNRRDRDLTWEYSEDTDAFFHRFRGRGNTMGDLIRENNRGWTFRNWLLTGNAVDLFCSRGEWEAVHEEGN